MTADLYINPHAAAMATHTAELDAALGAVEALADDLKWFDAFDANAVRSALEAGLASRLSLLADIEADSAALAALPDRTSASLARGVAGLAAALAVVPMGAVVGSLALGVAAVTGAVTLGRDPVAVERQRLHASAAERWRNLATLDETIAAQRAALGRYSAFDRAGVAARLDDARATRDRAEQSLARAVRDHDAAATRLQPIASQLAAARGAETALRARAARADELRRQLREAPNGAARARIHAACEDEFGTGHPSDVIRALAGELAGAERTTAKWSERLAFATKDAAHVIDHLVLDGSNLTYAMRGRQRRFVGLAVLDALVPELAGRFRLTVVFDASTRKRLAIPRSALEQRFGDQVEVHVAAAGRAADHTFLRYADFPTSWVVTNDQLRDFTDLPAVAEGRILRYELLDRMIEIPVLDVVAHFGP